MYLFTAHLIGSFNFHSHLNTLTHHPPLSSYFLIGLRGGLLLSGASARGLVEVPAGVPDRRADDSWRPKLHLEEFCVCPTDGG